MPETEIKSEVKPETTTPDTYDAFVGVFKAEDGYHKMYVKSNGEVVLGELVE